MEQLEQTALAPVQTIEAEKPLNDTGVCVKGYQLLIEIPDRASKRGNIYVPTETLRDEKVASLVGRVLEIGPESFVGDKFPAGARCQAGDYIMMSAYSGVRFTIEDPNTRQRRELRLIEDTSVLATVPSAGYVERA